MIRNKVVSYGETLKIPGHLSLGKYFLEKMSQKCEIDGEAVALVNGSTGEEMSFKQLLESTVNVAVGLKRLGVGRGDVVAFCSENRNELIPGFMGALCCGATITVYNILYNEDELKHALGISKPIVVICSSSGLAANVDTLKATQSINYIVQINGEPVPGVLKFKEIFADEDPLTYKSYEPEGVSGASDVAMICYSSGTTGLPKGVMLSHLNILYSWSTFDCGHFLNICQHILTVLPWYHVYGLITTTAYLICNKKIIFLSERFNTEKYLQTVQTYKAEGLMTVPPILVALSKSDIVVNYDVTSVKGFWCGAAPLSQQTANEMMKRFSKTEIFVQGYGMTETTLAVLKEVDDPVYQPGLLPVPGFRVKVVDLATGEKLGPNKEGEICVKGPSLMKGYVDNEAATRASFDDEGYLKTGDIGYYDENGNFRIIDRLKEVIKYKGHQVAPAAVESVILQHSGVAECGVVGAPDDAAGELPTAFVVLKPGANITAQELQEFTDAKLSPLARIRGGIIFVEEIPKNPSGKILRRLLKQKLITGMASNSKQ